MNLLRAALPLALAACGPLFPLPPEARPDGATVEPADAKADGAPTLDASVCTYPLRVGCVGAGGCTGYRECDPTETFLGPCTCYPDAGWDRPPTVDRGAEDVARADVADAPADVASAEDRPVAVPDVADAGARDAGLSPAYCIAHLIGCASNRDCAACGATPEGVAFCCSASTNGCYLRPLAHNCMP